MWNSCKKSEKLSWIFLSFSWKKFQRPKWMAKDTGWEEPACLSKCLLRRTYGDLPTAVTRFEGIKPRYLMLSWPSPEISIWTIAQSHDLVICTRNRVQCCSKSRAVLKREIGVCCKINGVCIFAYPSIKGQRNLIGNLWSSWNSQLHCWDL